MKSGLSTSKCTAPKVLPREQNARILMRYQHYLRHQKGLDQKTISHHLAAIERLDALTQIGSYKSFNSAVAMKFRKALAQERHKRTGAPLSTATTNPIMLKVRAFLEWLQREPGYRSKLSTNDIAYLTPLGSEERRRRGSLPRKFVSLKQAMKAFDGMPTRTPLERRNKAYFGMHLLTAGRTAAVATLPLMAFDRRKVVFDARYCDTKNQKTFVTYFNPVPDRVRKTIRAWIRELEDEHGFGPHDPIFPKMQLRAQAKKGADLKPIKEKYQSCSQLSGTFKKALEAIGIDGITPHSIRITINREVEKLRKNNLEAKAFSMNIGHNHLATTVESYMPLSDLEQEKAMKKLRKRARRKGK